MQLPMLLPWRGLAPLLLLAISSNATSSILSTSNIKSTFGSAQTQRVAPSDVAALGQQLVQNGAQTERVSIPSKLVPGHNLMQHGMGMTSRMGTTGAPIILSLAIFVLALMLVFCATVASASPSMSPSLEQKEAPSARLLQALGFQRSMKLRKVKGLQEDDEAEPVQASRGTLSGSQRKAINKDKDESDATSPSVNVQMKWGSMSTSLLGLQRSVHMQRKTLHEDEVPIMNQTQVADGGLLGLQGRSAVDKISLAKAEPRMEQLKESTGDFVPTSGVWLQQGPGVVTKTANVIEDMNASDVLQAATVLGTQTTTSLMRRREPLEESE